MTNGDFLRQMTDEELASFFDHISNCCIGNGTSKCIPCPFYGTNCDYFGVMEWLQEEMEDNEI
jgi:hypothetical protein